MIDLDRHGPWAVIAGGSEGVGAAFADQLAALGFDLLLIARGAAKLEAIADAVRAASGVEVRTLALDLVGEGAVERIVEATDGLEVGLLIYNAGANSHAGGFLDGDLAGFQGVIDLNVTVPLALAQHFGRAMRERRRGAIVLVGSMAGYLGSARENVYAAAKSFGRIFAEGLWLELRDHDVDVLELVLGVTRTPAMERAGLDFDLPGLEVSEPDEVVREGLARLGDGPVHIIGGNAAIVARQAGVERGRLVLGTHRALQALLPQA